MDVGRVKETVPLLNVVDLPASLAFYVDGLGFEVTKRWEDQGVLRWCWIKLGGASLMLQSGAQAAGKLGGGVTFCLMCEDAIAIWRLARERGLTPARPFVGNRLWVVSLSDPSGYRIDFESPADAPEESEYEGD